MKRADGWPSLNARDGSYRREMMSAMTLHNGQRADEGARPKWRPISFWPWTLAAAATVVIVAIGVTMALLAIADGAKPGTDRANSRLDAVRTGLAAGAGAGAAVGLMLAFRRQHHQEIATDLTDRDATERRITELYAKAVEQLGNDKAPVRLGGLYALERLAQDNPAHRQTTVNVLCAYLRMPFSAAAPTGNPGGAWQQERQVRLTAQRILAEHLSNDREENRLSSDPQSPRFWPGIRLDLVGATLMDFTLENGVIADADFSWTTFSGAAVFEDMTFSRDAVFDEATFNGDASFIGATFGRDAAFHEATFSGDAVFGAATFTLEADFGGATFSGDARFGGATFSRGAIFDGAAFSGAAQFDEVVFGGAANFIEAAFSGAAIFDEATFSTATGGLRLSRSRVLSPDDEHVWPTGWHVAPDGDGGYTVVRANDDASQPIPRDGSDGSRS